MLPTRRACEVLLALAASALAASGTTVWAQAIASVTPLALRAGQTQEFVLAGSGLADARQLWASFSQKSVVTPEGAKPAKNPAAA
jgi:hypothetical protein